MGRKLLNGSVDEDRVRNAFHAKQEAGEFIVNIHRDVAGKVYLTLPDPLYLGTVEELSVEVPVEPEKPLPEVRAMRLLRA